MLKHYYQQPEISLQPLLDVSFNWAEQLRPMVTDVSLCLYAHRAREESILFEGAQGTWLDVDQGTYPYVTSSNTCVGSVTNGAGVGPLHLDYVLGITKAYATRVGGGPFPTELRDEIGQGLAARGNEFGSVTGRPRRCGWLDVVMLKRAIDLNSVTGLCVTKLDVLDGLNTIKIAVAYRTTEGQLLTSPPQSAESFATIQPVYEDLPGWSGSTADVTDIAHLPLNARAYIKRIEALLGVPVEFISTGPERDSTILLRDLFD